MVRGCAITRCLLHNTCQASLAAVRDITLLYHDLRELRPCCWLDGPHHGLDRRFLDLRLDLPSSSFGSLYPSWLLRLLFSFVLSWLMVLLPVIYSSVKDANLSRIRLNSIQFKFSIRPSPPLTAM